MDAHQILGISQKATDVEIKKAYRKLVRKYHPDRSKDPDATEKFKIIKEAYEFLAKGSSSTGKFNKLKPVPPPPPPPSTYTYTSQTAWTSSYAHVDPVKVDLPVTIEQSFIGGVARVPGTPYYVLVPPSAEHNDTQRIRSKFDDGGDAILIDAKFQLYDPTGFYEIKMIDGLDKLCCRIRVTIASILAEEPVTFRNADPRGNTISVTLPLNEPKPKVLGKRGYLINYDRWYKISNAGLLNEGKRGILYVEPEIIFKPISSEIFPTLKRLKEKVDFRLKGYRYFT